MAKGITVTIPHNLGRAEASRRVRDGLDQVVALLVGKVQIEQSPWTNDGVSLSVKALGQTATATIAVEDQLIRIEGTVPRILSAFGGRVRKFVEQRGTMLLEKR